MNTSTSKSKRLLKPLTVWNKWNALCKKIKNDNTRRKTPGSKEAKRHAAMCGMKSMLEVECAMLLDKQKVKWKYESDQIAYHLCPNWNSFEHPCGVKSQTYTPDFTLKDGSYIEAKGKMTLDTRKKMEAVRHHHPEKIIHLFFGAANNKLYARPNSTRYWEWAEKNGFDWSERKIKKEWT